MSFTEHLWSGLRRPIRRSIRVKRFICGLCKRTTTLLFYDKKRGDETCNQRENYRFGLLPTHDPEHYFKGKYPKNEQKGLWYFRLLQTVYQKREAYQKWLKRGRERGHKDRQSSQTQGKRRHSWRGEIERVVHRKVSGDFDRVELYGGRVPFVL